MYDAIVVGARCGGSPTAMLLARAGHRVLLLDRAKFPSDTMSTHFIQMPGMVRLKEWGLLERVMATGCPPIPGGVLDIAGMPVEADFDPPHGVPGLASPRRTVLDKILVDGAVEAGAELREGLMIDSLLYEDGRVVGIKGHSATDPSIVERARIVIGADGRNSMVARSVGAEVTKDVAPLGAGYYSYWSGVECDRAEIFLHDDLSAVAFPTNDGLTTVALVVPTDRWPEMRKDDVGNVTAALDGLGSLGERIRAGEPAHDLIPVHGLPNFIKAAWGPGWALVGDAMYHKDPTPADGISDAFRGADYLAAALDQVFKGAATEEEAMGRYQESFEAKARPLFEQTITLSSFDFSPSDRATAFLTIQQIHLDELQEMGVAASLGAPS